MTRCWFVFLAAVTCAALGARPSAVGAKPPPTLDEAVKQALATFRKMDIEALRALARRDNPDPWVVADELFALDRKAARTFAKASRRPATQGLASFIERHKTHSSDKQRRALLRKAQAQRDAKELDAALKTLARLPKKSPKDILDARLSYVHGRVLLDQLKHKEGAEQLQLARERADALGWLAQAAACAEHEARGRTRRSDFTGALKVAKAWKAIEGQLGSKRGGGRAEGLMALIHTRQAAMGAAATCARGALEAGRETGDTELVGVMLELHAQIAMRKGQVSRARVLFEEALKTIATVSYDVPAARFAPDPSVVTLNHGTYLMTTGALASHFGEHALAWKRLAAAEKLARDTNNRRLTASVHYTTATLREKAGELDVAVKHYELAANAYRDMDDRAREARMLRTLAGIQARLGDPRAALASLDRALKTQKALGVRDEICALQIARGDILKELGEIENAAKAYASAEAAAKQSKLLRQESDAIMASGILFLEAGRYAESIEALQRALALARRIGDNDLVVFALCDVMRVHAAVGEPERAEAVFEEAEAILEGSPSDRSAAFLYIRYGRVLLQLEEAEDEALEMLGKGLAHAQKAKLHPLVAMARSSLAFVARGRQEWAKAIEHADAAASIYGRLKRDRLAAGAEINAAMAKLELGRTNDAKKQLAARLAKAKKAGVGDVIVQCHWGLARVALRVGDDPSAMAHARAAMDRMRTQGRFLAEGQGAAARAMSAPIFRVGAAAALRAKDEQSLYEFLEEGRAGTLLAALDGREVLQNAVVPKRLRDAEEAARRGEALALRSLEKARDGGTRAQRRNARRAFAAANLRLRDVMEEIQREVRAAAGLAFPTLATREQVSAALAPTEAFVAYGILENEVVAMVSLPKGGRTVRLGATDEIRENASLLLDLGRKPGTRGLDLEDEEAPETKPVDTAKVAATLRRLLVDPLELDKGVKRVVISPDGFLAYVPFALLMPDHEIAHAPSASVHLRLIAERDLKGDGVLALGDPVYTGRGLAALPSTRTEAQALGTAVFVGKDASETRFREQVGSKKRWRAINLACHGLIDPARPTLSSLALTADDKNDGYLTALDVFALQAPADLVTLSACETARGKLVQGEGVVGLTRAFLYAGSPRVLCSLWKVDDKATQALMVKFYELWNPKSGKGISAAAALRDAQAFIRGQKQWKSPYYWAAWILWGLPD